MLQVVAVCHAAEQSNCCFFCPPCPAQSSCLGLGVGAGVLCFLHSVGVGTCTAKGIEEAELMLGNVLAPTPNEVNLKDAEEELCSRMVNGLFHVTLENILLCISLDSIWVRVT